MSAPSAITPARHVVVHVLDVHVVDPICPSRAAPVGVAAAEAEMARVEQRDRRRSAPSTRSISRGASTNVAVWWWNAGLEARDCGQDRPHAATPSDEPPPTGGVEADQAIRPRRGRELRSRSAGLPSAKHRLCLCAAVGGANRSSVASMAARSSAQCSALAEADRDVAADEREAVVLEAVAAGVESVSR